MLKSPYQISVLSFSGWTIADQSKDSPRLRRLKYHIETGDYFGTLATVLDLMDQVAIENSRKIKDLKTDLLHLQSNYEIKKKKLASGENKN